MTRKLKPPFRAEHIGSFVRPDNLLNAARALKAGKIGNDELKRIADEAIVEMAATSRSPNGCSTRRRSTHSFLISTRRARGILRLCVTFRRTGPWFWG